MNKIPMNVPVFIRSSNEEQTSNLYTKAKLQIFYIGETGDHRLFTEDFANHIIETLPNVPVVGFYSEDDEDFKGHHSVQYIYGIVPESAKIEFEEKDGKTWAITDVILYTGRKDNIGTVASKIFGKQHSLELDPDTLKYKVNRDPNGRFMNLEFISGDFVGLSVLGDDEHPAFSGSEFFTTNEDFVKIIEQSEAKFSKFINLLNNNGGKLEVFNSEAFFQKCAENFAKITMQEFIRKLYAALERIENYGYIVENTDEYAVVCHWNSDENRCMYSKYSIVDSNSELALLNPVEVYAKYLTQEEINKVENPINTAKALDEDEDKDKAPEENEDDKKKDEEDDEFKSNSFPPASDDEDEKDDKDQTSDDEDKDDEDEKSKAAKIDEEEEEEEKPTSEPVEDEEDPKKKEDYSVDNANSGTNAEGDVANAKESEEPKTGTDTEDEEDEQDKVGNATASASATTLSDSERTELEQYRRAEKLEMIADYKGDISDDLLKDFNEKVDSYSKDELASALALEFRKAAKASKTAQDSGSSVQVRAFGLLNNTAGNYNENSPADVINKYKNR